MRREKNCIRKGKNIDWIHWVTQTCSVSEMRNLLESVRTKLSFSLLSRTSFTFPQSRARIRWIALAILRCMGTHATLQNDQWPNFDCACLQSTCRTDKHYLHIRRYRWPIKPLRNTYRIKNTKRTRYRRGLSRPWSISNVYLLCFSKVFKQFMYGSWISARQIIFCASH